MENNSQQLALGTEPIRKLLARYALPSIIAMTATSLYNMVDSIFIGQGCNALAIAGLAVTFPLMNLSSAFGAMVGIGAGTVISVKLGQKDKESAEMVMGNAVLLNVVIGLVFMAVTLTFLDEILVFFGASEQTLPYAREYMQILLLGNVLTHLYLGLNDVVRSSGYPQRAMIATLTAVGINAVFNYFFIFKLQLGIGGAALGTLCAQAVAFSELIFHFTRKSTYLRFSRRIFHFRKRIVKSILSIGMAPFLLNTCACVVVLLINTDLMRHGGDYYVGAYGIANRLVFVFIMVAQGINQGMQPIVGYNYGAGTIDRSLKTYRIAAITASCVTTVGFLFYQFAPEVAVRLFTNDEEMIAITVHALGYMSFFFPLVGFQIVSSGLFMSFGMAKKAIFLSMTRQLLFLIPFLIVLPRFFGTDGVWMSMPLADVLSIVVVAVMIFRLFRQFRKD